MILTHIESEIKNLEERIKRLEEVNFLNIKKIEDYKIRIERLKTSSDSANQSK